MKLAKWLIKEYSLFGVKETYKECSSCGYANANITENWNYCPRCGAKITSIEGANNG